MNCDAFAVGDGVQAGAKKLAVVVESVIGTATIERERGGGLRHGIRIIDRN